MLVTDVLIPPPPPARLPLWIARLARLARLLINISPAFSLSRRQGDASHARPDNKHRKFSVNTNGPINFHFEIAFSFAFRRRAAVPSGAQQFINNLNIFSASF